MTRKNLISTYLPLLAFIALVVGIWLPFGFKTIGTFEEWHIRADLLSGQNIYFISPDSALKAHALRPLGMLLSAVAHHLAPDSFLGFNLLQMAFFIGKGFFTYLILRKMLPHHLLFAFMVAVLFVFHPADTLVYTFRTINIHGAVMLYLIAVYLLLIIYEKPRWWLVTLMWIALSSSLMIYEVSYPIVAFTPVVLVWVAQGLNRRVIGLSLLWYIAPLLTGIYYIYVLLSLGSNQLYQTADREISTIPQVVEAIQKIYIRSFFESWREVQLSSPYLFTALILSGLVFATSLFLMQRSSREPLTITRYILMCLLGMGVIILGFAFYLIFANYHLATDRTYYLSALGAAISIGIIIYLVVGRKQVVFSLVMTLVIGFALINAFNQYHRYFFDIAMRQQLFLGQILEQLPSIDGKQTIFIRENTNQLANEESLLRTNATLAAALRYLYNNTQIEAVICYTSGSYMYADPVREKEPCTSPENAIVFDYSYENELKLMSDVIKQEAKSPAVFSCWPVDTCTLSFSEIIPVAPLTLDFDQNRFLGGGWSLPRSHDDINYRWTIDKESTVALSIDEETNYKISFQLYSKGVNTDGPDLFINDIPIKLSNSEGDYFEAVIPANVVHEEVDVLRFITHKLSPIGGGGVAIDWLKIEPFIPNDYALIEFDRTFAGTGWRDPETTQDGTTFRWSIDELASVNLGFLVQQDFWVSVTPMLILEPNALEDIELWVGGIKLDSLYDPGTKQIIAILPESFVQETEVTVLQVIVPQLVPESTGTYNLGVAIDQIRVEPLIRSDHVQIDFDESLSGMGWRGAETTREGVSFQWSIEETASIELGFLIPQDYRIEVLPVMILEPNTLEGVELWVEDTQLDSLYDPGTKQIIARLPRSFVQETEVTVLHIRVPQLVPEPAGTSNLGIAIDYICVTSEAEE